MIIQDLELKAFIHLCSFYSVDKDKDELKKRTQDLEKKLQKDILDRVKNKEVIISDYFNEIIVLLAANENLDVKDIKKIFNNEYIKINTKGNIQTISVFTFKNSKEKMIDVSIDLLKEEANVIVKYEEIEKLLTEFSYYVRDYDVEDTNSFYCLKLESQQHSKYIRYKEVKRVNEFLNFEEKQRNEIERRIHKLFLSKHLHERRKLFLNTLKEDISMLFRLHIEKEDITIEKTTNGVDVFINIPQKLKLFSFINETLALEESTIEYLQNKKEH